MHYTQDNIVQLIFDKIFNQITSNSADLLNEPFDYIKKLTFENKSVHKIIQKLTFKSNLYIGTYLANRAFQQKFLFAKLKNKLDVAICLSDISEIKFLLSMTDICISSNSIKLAVLTSNLEIFKLVCPIDFTDSAILTTVVENGCTDIYFYLKSIGLEPNICIYNKAVQGSSLEIIADINSQIGLSKETIGLVFESNNTSVILFIVASALEDQILIPPEYVSYPILNENFDLLIQLDKLYQIKWFDDLYYSAVLSGSVRMIKFVETKLPEIHQNFILDASYVKRGQSSLLSEEMIYVRNGKKYFSHVMTYAVQSKSLSVVKYVDQVGYGVTLSNIINAIQHSGVDILDYLLDGYNKKIPSYVLNYFNLNSYVIDKVEKFRTLFKHGFHLNSDLLNINDYRLDTAHCNLIRSQKLILSDQIFDPDYLIKYSELFGVGSDQDQKLITRVRMCLELGLSTEFDEIVRTVKTHSDKQHIVNTTYVFGSGPIIKQVMSMYQIVPHINILAETLCWGQFGKLSLVLPQLEHAHLTHLYKLSQIISDPLIDKFFQTNCSLKPELKYIVASGKNDKILEYVRTNKSTLGLGLDLDLELDLIKEIFLLDDLELVRELDLEHNLVVQNNLVLLNCWLKQIGLCMRIIK